MFTNIGNLIEGVLGFGLPGIPKGRIGEFTGKATLDGSLLGLGLPGIPKGRTG